MSTHLFRASDALIAKFAAHIIVEKGLSEKTIECYRGDLGQFAKFLRTRELSPEVSLGAFLCDWGQPLQFRRLVVQRR